MSNFVVLYLDTIQPQNPVITIEGNAVYTSNQLVNLNISVDDTDTTNYSMKIWGNVNKAHDSSIQDTEAASEWIPYSSVKQVMLDSTDGTKELRLKVRDDVFNASSIVLDSITLDQNLPTITVSSLDVTKVSKIAGKSNASFTFSANEGFSEFKIKRVSSSGAAESTGTVIPTTNGSVNTSGTAGYTAGQVITVTINGADLELAGGQNGANFIKVFVRELITDNWSV